MNKTSHGPLAARLRMLASALALILGGVTTLGAASVSATAPSPVADEATMTPGAFLVHRDTTAGNLTVNFTLSGTAIPDTDYTLSCPSAGANLQHVSGATTGSITILDNDQTETLVVTPIVNGIKGDLKVILTIASGTGYTVVSPTNAQVDIAEGEYTATVSVPAPVATEDTSVVDFSYDPGASRRGVLRVAFSNGAPPSAPPYDKALKVQFSGNSANPATFPGLAGADYDLIYKIGRSPMGSAVDASNGVGFNVVAYLASAAIQDVFVSGDTDPIPAGSTVYFNNDTGHPYTTGGAFTAPGLLHLTSQLVVNVHDGDSVTVSGHPEVATDRVSSPLLANSTACFLENGHGTISYGDVFTVSGNPGALYVVTSTTPITGSGQITFRHYSGGSTNSPGIDATVANSPTISTIFPVTPNNVGIVQLLVPAESAHVDFGVAPVADGIIEGHESVTMTLFQNFNYASIAPTAGELTIADADVTASIQATANAVQNSTPATFRVQLTGGFPSSRFPGGIAIPFTISGGTAVAGADYDFQSQAGFTPPIGGQPGILTIPANGTSGTITLVPRPTANLGSSGKTVTLELSPTTDYLLAAPSGGSVNSSATLSLLPAQPPKPSVTIALLDQANEFGPVTGHFRVTSLTAPTSDISITYNLSGTAIPSSEYTLPAGYSGGSGTVTIHANQTTVDIPIAPLAVAAFNPGEVVTATLIAGSGYDLGSATTANMVIGQDKIGVLAVTSPAANATYTINDSIPISVTFSAPVTVGATIPHLDLNAGAGVHAVYTSGDGTTTLTFTYTVGVGDASSDLDYASTTALGVTISDANSGALTVDRTLAAPGAVGSLGFAKALVIDGRPTLTITPATGASPSEPNTPAVFTVTSNSAVPADLSFTYQLGGTATPITDFTFPAGYSTQKILASQSTATITVPIVDDAAFNNNETIVATLQAGSGYKVGSPASASETVAQDTVVVTGVDSTNPDATYHTGNTIAITVSFTESVTVTGSPQLLLNTGSTSATATYSSGSPGTVLTFTYTVGAGDVSADLDYRNTAALPNGGAFASTAAGKTVITTLPSPGATGSLSASRNLVVDGTPGLIITRTRPAAEPSTNGIFTITSSTALATDLVINYSLAGTAVIGTDIIAPTGYTAGAGTVTLPHGDTITTIVIAPVDNPVLNTGETVIATLAAGTGYHLGSSTTASMTVVQDTIDLTGVTSLTADGTYHLGDTLTITVTFTSPVAVTGTPTLELATGSTNAVATYVSGSGSDTLSFAYTVALGDASTDLDYRNTGALKLNGGTLTGLSGESVHTTLAAPGATGSLGASKALVIDGSGGGGKLPPGSVATSSSGGGGCGLGSGIATLGSLLALAAFAAVQRARRR